MAKTFADHLENVIFVKAKFQFVGSSDDELSFNNGDVIVVTKEDDGGWWEGTLDGKIGWFPNNYVSSISRDPEPVPDKLPSCEISEENSQYHSLVVKNIVQTQKGHLDDIKSFLDKYLSPLRGSDILTKSDRDTLAGNYGEIVEFHVQLDTKLENESLKPIPEQRYGMCYLNIANQMKELYLDYCSNHPQAANIIAQYGDELSTYMESLGAPQPGSMTLTLMLSKPFLHVEKYGNQIKELERHIPEDHIDNLDMKKATQVLQIIALSCNEVRKKKEMEIQMLTGEIEGWKGEPVSNLGSLVYMGQVFVEIEDEKRKERYFCLFPKDFLVLSVSPQLVGYCFEGKHPISVITAKNIEDSETFFNGFHITVLDKLWKVMTSSPREKDVWMDALKKVLGNRCDLVTEKVHPIVRSDSKRSERSEKSMSAIVDPDLDTTDFVQRSYSVGPAMQNKKNSKIVPPRSTGSSPIPPQDEKVTSVSTISAVRGAVRQPVRKEWSFTRLRPTPPCQQKSTDEHIDSKKHASGKKSNKGPGTKEEMNGYICKGSLPNSAQPLSEKQILEEDMMILSVIEAYCFSNRTQHGNNCGSPESPYLPPDVPPHFSFKPITPARITTLGKQKTIKKFNKKKPREGEGSTEMFELKQQVQNLHKQTLYLRENLEEERKSRETFEKFLKKALKKIAPDIDWSEDGALHKTTPL